MLSKTIIKLYWASNSHHLSSLVVESGCFLPPPSTWKCFCVAPAFQMAWETCYINSCLKYLNLFRRFTLYLAFPMLEQMLKAAKICPMFGERKSKEKFMLKKLFKGKNMIKSLWMILQYLGRGAGCVCIREIHFKDKWVCVEIIILRWN